MLTGPALIVHKDGTVTVEDDKPTPADLARLAKVDPAKFGFRQGATLDCDVQDLPGWREAEARLEAKGR